MFLLHAFTPVPFLSFNFFIASMFLILSVFGAKPNVRSVRFTSDDALLLAIFLLGCLPLIADPSRIGAQNVKYAALWASVAIVSYGWVRAWALQSRITFAQISRAAAIACVILAASILAEFVLANVAGVYLSDFFPFSISTFPEANVFGEALRRPRGFAAEAGFSAIAFDCLLPLATYHLTRRVWRSWLALGVILPGYLVLSSGASLISFAVTAAIYLFTMSRRRGTAGLVVLAALALATLFMLTDTGQNLYEIVIGRKIDEFFAPSYFGLTTFSRPEAYKVGINIMAQNPFGIGWGGISQKYLQYDDVSGELLKGSGLISFPLEIGVSAGIAGLVLYVAVVARKISRLVRVGGVPAQLTFFSLLWVTLHHVVVLELWFPMIWFSMALADIVYFNALASRRRRQMGASDEFRPEHEGRAGVPAQLGVRA